MEKVKTEFMLAMRDGLDWLKEKKALDNKTYDRFYSELVDGIVAVSYTHLTLPTTPYV